MITIKFLRALRKFTVYYVVMAFVYNPNPM